MQCLAGLWWDQQRRSCVLPSEVACNPYNIINSQGQGSFVDTNPNSKILLEHLNRILMLIFVENHLVPYPSIIPVVPSVVYQPIDTTPIVVFPQPPTPSQSGGGKKNVVDQ